MTNTLTPSVDVSRELRGAQLPTRAPQAIVIASLVAGAAAYAIGVGPLRTVLIAWFVSLSLPVWSAVVEGSALDAPTRSVPVATVVDPE